MEQEEANELHPLYLCLPQHISREGIDEERDFFLRKIRETLQRLQLAASSGDGSAIQKHHFRVIASFFELKHFLPISLHGELIQVLVQLVFSQHGKFLVDMDIHSRSLHLLTKLLVKWRHLPRQKRRVCSVQIQWPQVLEEMENACFHCRERHCSQELVRKVISATVTCARSARYFLVCQDESQQHLAPGLEMWQFFKATIQSVDSIDCYKALAYFSILFVVPFEPDEAKRSALKQQLQQTLLPEWFETWCLVGNCSDWDVCWIRILLRVARRFRDLEWTPYLPFLFAKAQVLMNIPSDLSAPAKRKHFPTAFAVIKSLKSTEMCLARLFVHVLRPCRDPDPQQDSSSSVMMRTANDFLLALVNMFSVFFHPSNASNMALSLGDFLMSVTMFLASRLGEEKVSHEIRPQDKLGVQDCTKLIDELLRTSLMGIYSKNSTVSTRSMYVIRNLLCIDGPRCTQVFLDQVISAIDLMALNQTHQAPSAMVSLSVAVNCLMRCREVHSNGVFLAKYLAPILEFSLPGIDPNDQHKTRCTLQVYFNVLTWLPIANDTSKPAVEQSKRRGNVSEECFDQMKKFSFKPCEPYDDELDQKLWELGPILENWAFAVLDRVFVFIQARAIVETGHGTTGASNGYNQEHEVTLDVIAMTRLLFQQLSPEMYSLALKKTVRFVSGVFFGAAASEGKIIAALVAASVDANPEEAVKLWIPLVLEKFGMNSSSSSTTPKNVGDRLMANEKVWYLRILDGTVRFNGTGKALLEYSVHFRAILNTFCLDEDKKVRKVANKVLRHLLRALTGVYLLESRSLPPKLWDDAMSSQSGMFQYIGTVSSWKNLDVLWHEPNEEELAFAVTLLEDHVNGPLAEIDAMMHDPSSAPNVWHWLPLVKRMFTCVRGCEEVLNDAFIAKWKSNAVMAGSLSLVLRCTSRIANYFLEIHDVMLTRINDMMKYWKQKATGTTAENKIWRKLLFTTSELLAWKGIVEEYTKQSSRMVIFHKLSNRDVASKAMTKYLRRSGILPSRGDEVVLVSRNDLLDRIELLMDKRKIQQNYELAFARWRSDGDHGDINMQSEVVQWQLLDQVASLMQNQYEIVRRSATAVIDRSIARMYAPWIFSRVASFVDALENPSDDALEHEEKLIGILEFLKVPAARNFLWKAKNRPLVTRLICCLIKSNTQLVKRMKEEDGKRKIGTEVQRFYLSLLSRWRLESTESREQLEQVISALLQAQPPVGDHWRFHMMHMVSFLPFVDERIVPGPMELWTLVCDRVQDEIYPVRQIAMLLLSRLVWLLRKYDGQVATAKREQIKRLLFTPAMVKALLSACLENKKVTDRFGASEDGQHSNLSSLWSFGVKEILNQVALDASRSLGLLKAPLSPVRLLNRSFNDSFALLTFNDVQLVQDLVLLDPQEFGKLDVPKVFLTEFVTAHIDGTSQDDRTQALQTIAEWICGMMRAFQKRNLVDQMQDLMQTIVGRVLSQVNIALLSKWMQMFYFIAKPKATGFYRVETMQPLVHFLLNQADQSFKTATLEDFAEQAKWLQLLEPFVIHLLHLGRLKDPESKDEQELAKWKVLSVETRKRIVHLIRAHALCHPYEMVRDEAGKLLFLLSHFGGSEETSTLPIDTIVALTQQPESDSNKDALHARETVIEWLANCSELGDQKDFNVLLKPLFPILFETQYHSNLEVAVMAKNVVDDLAAWIHLFPLPRSSTTTSTLVTGQDVSGQWSSSHQVIHELLNVLEKYAHSTEKWKLRGGALRFLTPFGFFHWFVLGLGDHQTRIESLVLERLKDDQREVQEMAKVTLRSIVHLQKRSVSALRSQEFLHIARKSRLLYSKLQRKLVVLEKQQHDTLQVQETLAKIKNNESRMVQSCFAMASFILAFPFSVPDFVPALVEEMSQFLFLRSAKGANGVVWLEKLARETLLEFKRTHQDNWKDHATKFTPEQLEAFQDLLISPHYYA